MTVACPSCGSPVEFRYDDSFVRVCDHCGAAVGRSDRGIETLGTFADLAPIESPLRLFADGKVDGEAFMLVGMAQLQHAAGGTWQEWYAKLGEGRWAWMSEAQGRLYVTYEVDDVDAPTFGELAPGHPLEIAHAGKTTLFTVGELGTATYASARGEIPYRLVPGAAFRFADCEAADGSFLTIDYGDPAEPPTRPSIYLGRQVALADLGITGGEALPADGGAAPARGRSFDCPNCNGKLDLHAPDRSLRLACPYCGSILSLETPAAQLLARQQNLPTLELPLGSKGTFVDGELTVIGFLQRGALDTEGTWWPFYEYLLFAPAVGFRWLVSSDGHWSYVQPVSPAAVTATAGGQTYDGVKFERFSFAQLRVDAVLGEFYWRVQLLETVDSEDYIAPPALLSVEKTAEEVNWSLATYMAHREVMAAFGRNDLPLAPAVGVAPNQVNHARPASRAMLLGLAAVFALGIVFDLRARDHKVFAGTLALGPGSGSGEATAAADTYQQQAAAIDREIQNTIITPGTPMAKAVEQAMTGSSGAGSAGSGSAGAGSGSAGSASTTTVYFSPTFHLDARENIEMKFDSPLANDWAYVAADLVNNATGDVTSTEADLSYYFGDDDGDGDAWSEGDRTTSELIGPLPAGDYVLRLEGEHDAPTKSAVTVEVDQGVFRWKYWLLALLAMGVPAMFVHFFASGREGQRRENSNL